MTGGFTLGGKTASALGLELLQGTQRRILPDTRDIVLTIPGRPGAYDFGAEFGVRLFELECLLHGAATPEQLQIQIRNLTSHLIGVDGRPRTLELIFDDEPDKYYKVRFAGSLPIEQIVSVGRFTLPLVAYDPHAYALKETVEHATVNDSPAFVVVDKVGNAPVPPKIRLVNTGTTVIHGFELSFGSEKS